MSADEATPARLSIEHGIGELAFDNGPLNLVDHAMLRAFARAVDAARSDDTLRCLIVHGSPRAGKRAFCAGSNIGEFDTLRSNASEQKILVEDSVLRKLAGLAIPTIAAIDGAALGGGFEIALACDLRVVRDGVPLGLPECRLGGLAGSGSVRLARLVGPSRAKELLFLGETISAQQALAWGIVNRVVGGADYVNDIAPALAAARAMAATIVTRGPLSMRFSKQLVDAAHNGSIDSALVQSTVLQQRIFDSEDLYEGAAAFFAKRDPEFKGR